MRNKKILIFGFAGSIGEELTRQLAPNNKIYGVDIDETRMFDLVEELGIQGRVGNVEDKWTVYECFNEFKPDIVFHAAARKHVTPSEQFPMEAITTNVLGTYNVAYYSKAFKARLINISTDKVINGESIMGLSKKIAEKICRNMGFVSVRFGNVMGSRGSVLPIWQKQIIERKPLTITHPDMERFMMTIPEAVHLIITAAQKAKSGEIWIMDMGKPVKILDLAKQILDKAELTNGIKIIGIRPGETLSEDIMTAEESKRARRVDNFFVI